MYQNNFSGNLKESKNIALVANPAKGADSLCAAISLAELVKEFIQKKEISVSVYFSGEIPEVASNLVNSTTVYKKFGEKTLYVKFPLKNVSKVIYNFENQKKYFNFALVGVDEKTVPSNEIEYEIKQEEYDTCIGVGFNTEDELKKYTSSVGNIKVFFNFSTKNLGSDSLTKGVIDLYFKENVVPSKLASLAFFTYLGEKH